MVMPLEEDMKLGDSKLDSKLGDSSFDVQARSQEFAMGGCLGGLERSPQPPEARGLGAEPPALENFAFFCKNNIILGLFWLKIMLLKRGLEIGSANKIKLVA